MKVYVEIDIDTIDITQKEIGMAITKGFWSIDNQYSSTVSILDVENKKIIKKTPHRDYVKWKQR